MDKLRIAVIGQGRSGRDIHGEYFKSEENKICQVTVVCELLEERRQRAAEEFGCEVVSNYRELIGIKDKYDLVVNASFSYMHYLITKELLENGINVLVEKPFSATVEECEDLIKTAKDNGAQLFVFQQSLLAPNFKKVCEIVRSGKLGKLEAIDIKYPGLAHRYDWQTLQCFVGGALYNTGPHPVGQALELLGWNGVKLEYSYLKNINSAGDAEDYVRLILSAPNGAIAEVEISPCDSMTSYGIKVQCQNGTIVANMNKYEMKYIAEGEFTVPTLTREPLSNDKGLPAYCSEKLIRHEESGDIAGSSFDMAVKEFYEMVYDAIKNAVKPKITPEMIVEVVRVMEQCHKQNPLEKRYSL